MREGIESESNLRSRQYRLILSLGLSHFSPGFWHFLFPVTMAWSSPIVAVLESMSDSEMHGDLLRGCARCLCVRCRHRFDVPLVQSPNVSEISNAVPVAQPDLA